MHLREMSLQIGIPLGYPNHHGAQILFRKEKMYNKMHM